MSVWLFFENGACSMAVLFREILFSFVLRLYYICGQFVLHLKASLLLRSICITFEGLITIVFNTDLIRDTRYLCTRFRINGLKAKSRGISEGKQLKKFVNTSNHGRTCLFSQNETKI